MMRLMLLAILFCLMGTQAHAATRIKDIVSVQGVRPNQLIGYGLVIGLNGTGDSLRNAPFTGQSIQSMLDRMGETSHQKRRPVADLRCVRRSTTGPHQHMAGGWKW